jgi:hypothetical protein
METTQGLHCSAVFIDVELKILFQLDGLGRVIGLEFRKWN